MLRPSKKLLFAIEAVLDIAYHAGGEPVQSREITRRQGIPRRYLEQTLQHLVRIGILVGVRGPHGGYRLARERRRVMVGEIIRALRDMDPPDDLYEDLPGSPLGLAVVRPMWESLEADLMEKLDSLSIDDLCLQAWKKDIPSEAQDAMDFTI